MPATADEITRAKAFLAAHDAFVANVAPGRMFAARAADGTVRHFCSIGGEVQFVEVTVVDVTP